VDASASLVHWIMLHLSSFWLADILLFAQRQQAPIGKTFCAGAVGAGLQSRELWWERRES